MQAKLFKTRRCKSILTATDIFKTACGYLSQTVEESDDVAGFAPGWLNVLLAESFEAENALRRADGMPQLSEVPFVSIDTMQKEIPYHDILTRIALPYGLASDLERDAEDDYRVNLFRNLYIAALEEAARCVPEPVEDAYA